MPSRGQATLVSTALLLALILHQVACAAVFSLGPPSAAFDARYLLPANASIAFVDITSTNERDRAFVISVVGDSFRGDAPAQFKTSSLVLSGDGTTYLHPYGLTTVLNRVSTTADLRSLHTASSVVVVNGSLAIVTFGRVPWYDGGDGESVTLSIDGAMMNSGRSLGPMQLIFAGPGRSQDVAWAVFIVLLTVATAVTDAHGIVDLHILVSLLLIPCAHSPAARIGGGLWRLLSPIGFSEPLTPAAVLGAAIVLVALFAGTAAFGFVRQGNFAAAPMLLSRWWYSALCFIMFPAMLASWLCMTRAESVALIFLGLFGLATCCVGPILVVLAWGRIHRHMGRYFGYAWHKDLPWYHRAFYPNGFWSTDLREVGETAIRDVAGAAKSAALLWPPCLSFPCAVVLGSAANNPADCAAEYGLVAVHFGIALFASVITRRRRAACVTAADAFVALGTLLVAAGGANSATSDANASPVLTYVGVAIALVAATLRVAYVGWLMYVEADWIRLAHVTSTTAPGARIVKAAD